MRCMGPVQEQEQLRKGDKEKKEKKNPKQKKSSGLGMKPSVVERHEVLSKFLMLSKQDTLEKP